MSKVKSNPLIWWGAILWCFVGTACYEPVEGCLDIGATNFNVEADQPCPDNCCEYPTISLDFRHRVVFPDTIYNLVYLDSVYLDDFGNPFRIKDIQFYLSDFRLLRANGTEVRPLDSLSVTLLSPDGSGTSATVADNFALVNRNNFADYEIGTVEESGAFEAIRFNIGLGEVDNTIDPASVSTSHPLAFQEPEMYWSADSGYVFNRLELFRDTISTDTIPTVLEMGTAANFLPLQIPPAFQLEVGFNIVFTIQIDYALWFVGLDIKNDSAEVLKNKIVENIAQSFSLIAIEQSTP